MNTNKPAGGAQFTPGPWFVDDEVCEDNAGQETLGIYADSRQAYGYVAGIHCAEDVHITDEDKANAHLIAAAPEMYMALQAFIKAVSFEGGTESIPLNILIVADRAKDALAQAEGKAL